MTAGELIAIMDNSQKLQVIEGGKVLFCGWIGLLPYSEAKERIKAAEVKRFSPYLDIKHKEWESRGLMKPLEPEETPDYSFSDLQLSLYSTIYI